MVKCFLCGGNAGYWGKGFTDLGMMMKDNADKLSRGERVQIKIPNGMNEKDRICGTCIENGKLQTEVIGGSESLRGSMPKDFESTETKPSGYQPPAGYRPPGIESPSGYEPPKTNSTSQNVSAAQLRGIAQAFHDQFKKDWDSTGVVQFKNNQIAILKRVWGQQVQFIVAYDHVTKEGYRLMAIDEGITAQGSGFSGGASAFFYFQRMDFVR